MRALILMLVLGFGLFSSRFAADGQAPDGEAGIVDRVNTMHAHEFLFHRLARLLPRRDGLGEGIHDCRPAGARAAAGALRVRLQPA